MKMALVENAFALTIAYMIIELKQLICNMPMHAFDPSGPKEAGIKSPPPMYDDEFL